MGQDFNEYADLGQTGYKSTEPVKPEDEFFHSLYISGVSRQNHINVTEEAGKMQIRGIQYNLTDVNMIITHVKKILCKNETGADQKQKVGCFSFKKEPQPPWVGWNNRVCGTNSAERAANSFCKDCREQIIVAGIFVDDAGNPILHAETKSPLFIFLRGRGMKYNNVSQFLADCYKEEVVNPIFLPATPESTEFEKIAVNNKRAVTKIGMGKAKSNYGDKDVFTFTKGTILDNQSIFNILEISKKSLAKFNEKFDWSKPTTEPAGTTGYADAGGPLGQPVDQSNVIPEAKVEEGAAPKETAAPQQQTAQPTFNFEDIKF